MRTSCPRKAVDRVHDHTKNVDDKRDRFSVRARPQRGHRPPAGTSASAEVGPNGRLGRQPVNAFASLTTSVFPFQGRTTGVGTQFVSRVASSLVSAALFPVNWVWHFSATVIRPSRPFRVFSMPLRTKRRADQMRDDHIRFKCRLLQRIPKCKLR